MTSDVLLAKLDGVRQTGPGRWIAKCPAHDDRAPSLSIRALDDGRTLLHCFSGDAVRDILLAIGLDFDALYPPRAIDHRVRRDPFDAKQILLALSHEAQLAAITAARVACGHSVTWDELDRLVLAAGRIATAADVFRPRPTQGRRARLDRVELEEALHA